MDSLQIVQRLQANGHQAYYVGGAVRDMILGVQPKDVDIATSALPAEVATIFPGTVMVGSAFGVSLVHGHEVATFRKDTHTGIGDKHCTVEYTRSLKEDLARRDFTINAMAYDPVNSMLYDPFGGLSHVMDRRLQFVGDPFLRLKEDPNRALRAFRFEGAGYSMDFESFRAICHSVDLLRYIAPERIRMEILKAMGTPKPSAFWGTMRASRWLQELMPEFDGCHGFDGGKHHRESVWEHCMIAGDSLSPKRPLLRLAGYWHDIGKPTSYNRETMNFRGHDEASAKIARDYMTKLRFSAAETQKVEKLIEMHMLCMSNDITAKGMRRNIARLRENGVCIHDFLRLRIADHNANMAREALTYSQIKRLVCLFDDHQFAPGVATNTSGLAINGHDLMREFKLASGPQIGVLLRHLLDYVMESPDNNTGDKLLQRAAAFLCPATI